jgi:hypothetical protein
MRAKILMALTTALAVAALGVVPAGASASVVTLVNKSGEALKVGTAVTGTSGSFKLYFSGGQATCATATFSGKVTQNQSSPATIEVTGSKLANCAVSGIPMVIDSFSLGSSIELFTNGTTSAFPINLDWHWSSSPENLCDGGGASSFSFWSKTGVGFSADLAVEGEGCPEAQTLESGVYALSSGGQTVQIITQP